MLVQENSIRNKAPIDKVEASKTYLVLLYKRRAMKYAGMHRA